MQTGMENDGEKVLRSSSEVFVIPAIGLWHRPTTFARVAQEVAEATIMGPKRVVVGEGTSFAGLPTSRAGSTNLTTGMGQS